MFYFSLIFEILALHKLLLSRMTIGLAYQKVYSFKLDKVFFPSYSYWENRGINKWAPR